MPKFSYTGKSRDGKTTKGDIEAANESSAVAVLRRQGIQASKVKVAGKGLDMDLNIGFLQPKITTKDIVVFTRQFATMIDAGLPLVQCLEILSNQQENKTFKAVLTEVKEDVESGSTFADALKKHPKAFNDLYVNLVAAGEVGGILDTILNRLAAYIEKALKLKKQVKSAMTYPTTIIGIAFVVIAVILVFVIPAFEKMFADFGGALPMPTQIVINISNFVQNYILVIIGVIVFTVFAVKKVYATEKGRDKIDDFALKLPVFGVLIRKVAVAKFSRTMSTMISSGVPILDGLDIVSKTAGNRTVEKAINNVRVSISEGKTIAEPLKESGVFPPMVCQMIEVGEQAGALDTMLSKIADFYDDEVDDAVGNLTAMMEPLLMLFLGTTVGGLVIAMYSTYLQNGWDSRRLMPATQAHAKEHFKIDYRSLTWYLASRAAVITFLLGGASIFYLRGNVASSSVVPLLILVAVSYAQALFSVLILRWIKRLNLFAQVQIVWDLLFVTALILLTGGVESLFSFAYLLVIVSASFLLPRRETVFAAASAAILFGGLLDLQYFNYLQNIKLYRSVPDSVFLSAVFVHVVAFLLTAVLSGTLAERWRFSEAELTRKKIDFAELEKLNRTILSHISSGLMLISPIGRILSFNRAASEITGLMLEDIYGQQVELFFPELPLIKADGYHLVSRQEGTIKNATGQQLILGYATTVARGYDGEELGLLVTFQDLTQLKKVEEDLKRVDRLAAVGRLASGMAHEIRNPLASISGSIQLLLEAEHVAKEDRRLMGIVVKEAERLSELLTDFLTFARPKPPQKEAVDICAVLDELGEMLAGDRRFDKVEIRTDCSNKTTLFIDRGQIWQVLWDLAINAAEAIQDDGVLLLKYASEKNQIIVEDSGPGISPAIVGKIFDPFFSTKEKGTGLGLASVYAVVEAHGGRVEVSRSDNLGGARFVLDFS